MTGRLNAYVVDVARCIALVATAGWRVSIATANRFEPTLWLEIFRRVREAYRAAKLPRQRALCCANLPFHIATNLPRCTSIRARILERERQPKSLRGRESDGKLMTELMRLWDAGEREGREERAERWAVCVCVCMCESERM